MISYLLFHSPYFTICSGVVSWHGILTALIEYLTVLLEYLDLLQSKWQHTASTWEGLGPARPSRLRH